MKKAFMILLALVISVAFITTVFAQTATDKATKAATDMAQEKAKDKAKAVGDTAKDKAVKTVTDKAAPAPEKAVAAPEKKAEKKAATKAKVHQYTGEVTAVDMAAKTVTVKGKKGDMTFDVTDAKMKGEPKAGDKAMVKYMEKDGKMIAKSVGIKGAKKAAKKVEKAATPAPAK